MPAGRPLPILRAPNAGVAQLVEQSLRKREVGGSSPSTGTRFRESRFWRAIQSLPLPIKLALAVFSGGSSWLIDEQVNRFDWDTTIFGNLAWPSHLAAVIFGALVMAPYAAASRARLLRVLGLCVASALIYFYAVKFVADGPFSYNAITPFLISGAGAALLIGLSVVVLAPRKASWRLFAMCLVAGLVGGAAFEDTVWLGSDFAPFGGHLVWQVLVCLALHFGLRPAPA